MGQGSELEIPNLQRPHPGDWKEFAAGGGSLFISLLALMIVLSHAPWPSSSHTNNLLEQLPLKQGRAVGVGSPEPGTCPFLGSETLLGTVNVLEICPETPSWLPLSSGALHSLN